MAKLSRDLASTTLHPRESLYVSGGLGALNAEIICDSDGCASIGLDVRGSFVGTVEVSGTLDGVNWTLLAIRPVAQALTQMQANVTAAGAWAAALNAPYRKVRARMTAYTSGLATATIVASTSELDPSYLSIAPLMVTAVGLAGAAQTLTIPAPTAGLRIYVSYVEIIRFAAAVLTAAATPVTVTTTNLPGSVAFTMPADAAALGTAFVLREDFAWPVASTSAGTATTIICPATTGVIWRITAGYYLAQ
jgi:hypothetical protein